MTKTFTRSALILAAMAAVTAGVPALAAADDNTIPTRLSVAIDHADLASDAGVASLRSKVVRAARAACRPVGNTNGELAHARVCLEQAVAQGNAQIDAMLAHRRTAGTPALAASVPGEVPAGH